MIYVKIGGKIPDQHLKFMVILKSRGRILKNKTKNKKKVLLLGLKTLKFHLLFEWNGFTNTIFRMLNDNRVLFVAKLTK